MKEALLVIDMLNDFVLEGAPLEVPNAREIIPFIQEKIKLFNGNKQPIFYVCDAHRENDREFTDWPIHAIEDTKGANVIKELCPSWPVYKDFVVYKRSFSGFFETNLDKLLKKLGVGTVCITGILTDICVLITAIEAKMRGYEVVVYKHGTAAMDNYDSYIALEQMKNRFKIEII